MPKSGSTDHKKEKDGTGTGTGNAGSTENAGSELKKSSKSSRISKAKKASGETMSKEGSGKSSGRSKKTIKAPDEDKFDKLKKELEQERKTDKEKEKIKSNKEKKSKKYNLDKTQWENTEWKSQYDKYLKGEFPDEENKKKSETSQQQSMNNNNLLASHYVPGENFQGAKEKGAYLLDFPLFSLILSVIEFILYLVLFILAILTAGEHIFIVIIFLVNSLVLMILTVASALVQYRRWHVKSDVDLNGHLEFTIKPSFRRIYASFHFGRLWISFSCTFTLLYYIVNGDKLTELHTVSFYSQSPIGLLTALVVSLLAEVFILVQLFFFFKNRMTITSCRK
ncbi:unnamed protein product [Bursaphelenchus xylophilus]|uniref:(pine wood nematode) hypothetical protein n=1 Tax=Bursaphelenchus xylophilus TaxID=6326 RepID=A0A1I7RRN9_BURXY|nr:unnamed protein product [Bursaphelenchus xylophilus]CAG9123600.1 unnamed protein product [Bursaphelenchus xylophilus]